MNRERAEKLLAALIFDDLDEASKAELQAYLQTDDDLRERLADMRMAARLARDAVKDGPDPVLSENRLAQLKQLAGTGRAGGRVFRLRYFLAPAAVLVLGLALLWSLMLGNFEGHTDKAFALSEIVARQEASTPRAPTPPEVAFRETDVRTDRSQLLRLQAERSAGGPGGMGGMGGYGGGVSGRRVAPAKTKNRAPTETDHDSLKMTGGSSLDESTRVASAPPAGQPLAPAPMMDHKANLPTQLDDLTVARAGGEQAGPIRFELNGRADSVRPSSAPTLMNAGIARSDRSRGAAGEEKIVDGTIETAGGSSLRASTPVASAPPGVLPSLGEPMPDSSPSFSRRVEVIRGSKVKSDELAFETDGRFNAGQPLSGPASVDASGSASAERPGRVVIDEEARRRLVGVKSSESGGSVSYGWSGTLTPQKSPVPMPATTPPAPIANADVKSNSASGVVDSDEDAAGKRVPILGDTPAVGGLFRQSEPEMTYPKNWAEIQPEQKAGISGETQEGDVPLASHFRVVPVNPWVMTDRDHLSTFALDVDTASYALCRRYIRSGFLPPIGAVRMEEFINAFDYAYPQRDDATFAVYAEGAPSPFAAEGQDLTLLKIAVKARTVGRDQRRAAHLVFVVDASASMGQPDRLPAVQATLNLLVNKLSDADRVSLISCANEARLHLEAVPAQQKDVIRQAIDGIQPAGPTNLMAGLRLGYAMARKAFVAGRINQVVLCSDGVANVGQTEAQAVLDEVAGDRKQGITLTCVGVGYGAYNDAFLEAMADSGDGRYVFLDSSEDARDALVGQLAATLQTVAKDARIQVEFNPARVRRYRLIGYENRDIEDQRFRDDTIDAGEVGSGQCSTALYELELMPSSSTEADDNLGTVFVRYRHAETGQVEEVSRPLAGSLIRRRSVEEAPRFFLAAGTARFAEWLRQSEHAQHTALADVQRLLDNVSAALPLDRDVQDLAALAHQAENLPRASTAAPQP